MFYPTGHVLLMLPSRQQAEEAARAIAQAGIAFSGYPSLVARVCGQPEDSVFLLLIGGGLRIVHVTLHESVQHALRRRGFSSLIEVFEPGTAFSLVHALAPAARQQANEWLGLAAGLLLKAAVSPSQAEAASLALPGLRAQIAKQADRNAPHRARLALAREAWARKLEQVLRAHGPLTPPEAAAILMPVLFFIDVLGLAALRTGAYRPRPGERVALVICGANVDPATLA